MTLVNKQIVLVHRPSGMPDDTTFNIVETNIHYRTTEPIDEQ